MDTVTQLVGLAFAALGVATRIPAIRGGVRSLHRLSSFFLLLAVLASTPSPAGAPQGDIAPLTVAWLLGSLAAYPFLLLRYTDAIAPLPRPLWRWLAALTAVQAAAFPAMLATMSLQDAALLMLAAQSVIAVAAHAVTFAVTRRRTPRMSSNYARVRAATVNIGLTLVGGALAIGVFEPRLRWLTLTLATVSVTLLIVGAAPPRWMRSLLLQQDLDAIESHVLATAADADAGAAAFLEAVRVLVRADLVDLMRDHSLVATAGATDAASWDQQALQHKRDGPAPIGATVQVDRMTAPDDSSRWLIRAGCDGDVLSIATRQDPVSHGLHDTALLPRLVRRIGHAMDASSLTEQRQLRELAEQQSESYRATAALKDDLLSTINHELRTPLTTVNGALALVTDRWDSISEMQRRQLVERAAANASTLQLLVLDVLDLAALRAGSVVVANTEVRVQDLIEAAIDGLGPSDRLDVRVEGTTCTTDQPLTSRTIRHLVRNALEHTHGMVIVDVRATSSSLEVQVFDEGSGVPPELVEPMARGGHYLHRTSRGLGIGLALVRETVRLQGGSMSLLSPITGGTTVRCELPALHPVSTD
ncbi:MAG: signal transduction histidine kinase [Nitriliruptoraceae bacterium]|jgi:signal transduction histidine kinase